jgi:hypothetical protein
MLLASPKGVEVVQATEEEIAVERREETGVVSKLVSFRRCESIYIIIMVL